MPWERFSFSRNRRTVLSFVFWHFRAENRFALFLGIALTPSLALQSIEIGENMLLYISVLATDGVRQVA